MPQIPLNCKFLKYHNNIEGYIMVTEMIKKNNKITYVNCLVILITVYLKKSHTLDPKIVNFCILVRYYLWCYMLSMSNS